METQHIIVYPADGSGVAAFVDASDTMGYPSVEVQSSEIPQIKFLPEGSYIFDNATVIDSEIIQRPLKRFRTNPKKQKEVIEMLFEKQKAVVTEKAFMNLKGNKRFKSDVWSWFGDIKLLISRSEAKKLKIPYYIRQCGDEQMMLSKLFVGCFRCSALFIHDAQRSGTSTLRAHMRVCSRPRPRRKKGSPTIIFFSNKSNKGHITRPATVVDRNTAQEQILNFLLSTESSFDIVEEPEFFKLLQMCISIGATFGDINIDSMLCPQEKLSDFLLNDLYVSSINSFYTEYQYTYGTSFNVNVWVEEQHKYTYISVICHFASNSGELKSIMLHTDEFNCESKTSENVKDWFTAFLANLPVIPNKRIMVIDNLSNMVSVFKDEECIRCAVQNINLTLQAAIKKALLAVQNDYPDFVTLVNGCKDLVTYFNQIANQYQLAEPLKNFKEDNWISLVSLFNSVNNQYDEILSILNETGETHLLSIDKAVIFAVINLFRVFDEALMELSNGAEPTLNIVIPWEKKLKKHCMSVHDDFPVIRQLKVAISEELNEHLTKNISVYHRVATLLDPRYKRITFSPRDDQIAANIKAKCLVKECMEAPSLDDFIDNQKAQNDSSIRDCFTELYSGNSFEGAGGGSAIGGSEKSAHREVDNYLTESFHMSSQDAQQQHKFNPLKYWSQNSERYPNLSKIALWILSCPASCIQTEETFWNNDWLVNICRIHQRPENVNKALFVKSYRKI